MLNLELSEQSVLNVKTCLEYVLGPPMRRLALTTLALLNFYMPSIGNSSFIITCNNRLELIRAPHVHTLSKNVSVRRPFADVVKYISLHP